MKVLELMRRVPRYCLSGDSVASAGRTMAEAGVGVLPVIDASRRVTGVITDRDVCCALARSERPEELEVRDVASSPAWTCRPEDELPQALAIMRGHAVRRLPVVDEDGTMAGLLSLDEIVLAATLLEGEKLGGPLHTEVVQTLQSILRPPTALVEMPSAASVPR